MGDTFIAHAREQGSDERAGHIKYFFPQRGSEFSVVGARIYRPHGAAMRELVSIQGGQCGNQIGAKFWEVGFYLLDRREVCSIQCVVYIPMRDVLIDVSVHDVKVYFGKYVV